MKYIRPSDVDSPAQGSLNQARSGKAHAYRKVRALREQLRNEPIGANRSGIRFALNSAVEGHREWLRMERDALGAIEERAQQIGRTTIRQKATP